LLERDGELRQLADALARAESGRGGVVALLGAAGVGKTRLLTAVRDMADERGMTVLSARGATLERDFPFGVARQLFEPLAIKATSRERERLFSGAAALSLNLISPSESPPQPAAASDPTLAILNSLYWLVANLAQRGPLLLVTDDAHWADGPSLRLLNFLAGRLDELSVLGVVAARPSEGASASDLLDELITTGAVLRLEPAPLSSAATTELVRSQFQADAEPSFIDACHETTGGNPFYLGELLREATREEIRPIGANAHLVRELGPESIAKAVVLRLAQLPPATARLAAAAAVLGDGAGLNEAAALADMDKSTAASAADALVNASVLEKGSRLSFIHPVVGTAVYSDLPPHERARTHARAALMLAAAGAPLDRIAGHLLVTDPAGEPQVAEILQAAARAARANGALDTAVAYLRRALEEPPPPEMRSTIFGELGSAEFRVGDPQGVQHLKQALELAESPHGRVEVVQELALGVAYAGEMPAAIQLLQGTIGSIQETEPDLALLLEAQLAGFAYLDMSTARLVSERLRRYDAEEIRGRTPAERLLLANLAYKRALAGEAAEQVSAIAERVLSGGLVEDQTVDSPAVMFAVMTLLAADRLEVADRAIEEALADARTRGSALGFALVTALRSNAHWRRGQMAAAEAEAHTAVEVGRAHGFEMGLPMALAFLVDALIERGEFDVAEREVTESGFGDQLEHSPHLTVSRLLLSRGKLRLLAGRAEEALNDLLTCGRRCEAWGARNPAIFAWRSNAALALAKLDKQGEARETAAEEVALARAFGAPRALGIALRAYGLVSGGREGIRLLEESVSVLEPTSATLELARALTDLGGALRRTNRRSDARKPLDRGLELAQQCGASLLAERAYSELSALGSRPRRPIRTGVDALTPSERRIAAMAAEGQSNKDIAQTLFVTLKTVEMHLSNAFRKLDIKSRRELAGALNRGEAKEVTATRA
jgi:DNA-binding CsgD family transcriptional regulator